MTRLHDDLDPARGIFAAIAGSFPLWLVIAALAALAIGVAY